MRYAAPRLARTTCRNYYLFFYGTQCIIQAPPPPVTADRDERNFRPLLLLASLSKKSHQNMEDFFKEDGFLLLSCLLCWVIIHSFIPRNAMPSPPSPASLSRGCQQRRSCSICMGNFMFTHIDSPPSSLASPPPLRQHQPASVLGEELLLTNSVLDLSRTTYSWTKRRQFLEKCRNSTAAQLIDQVCANNTYPLFFPRLIITHTLLRLAYVALQLLSRQTGQFFSSSSSLPPWFIIARFVACCTVLEGWTSSCRLSLAESSFFAQIICISIVLFIQTEWGKYDVFWQPFASSSLFCANHALYGMLLHQNIPSLSIAVSGVHGWHSYTDMYVLYKKRLLSFPSSHLANNDCAIWSPPPPVDDEVEKEDERTASQHRYSQMLLCCRSFCDRLFRYLSPSIEKATQKRFWNVCV